MNFVRLMFIEYLHYIANYLQLHGCMCLMEIQYSTDREKPVY